MPFIPPNLRRNAKFQDDFRRFSQVPIALIEELADGLDARMPRMTSEQLTVLAHNHGVSREAADSAESILRFMASRATPRRLQDLDSEFTELAERTTTPVLVELLQVLKRRFAANSPTVRAESETRALRSQGGMHDLRFRPTVVLSSDEISEAFAGLLCELHYHDSDDNHHDISFTLTPGAAADLLTKLQEALEKLDQVRSFGSVSIANRDDLGPSNEAHLDD